MQRISEEYLSKPLTVRPGDRLHRLVALLFDTWFDDLTTERIAELERLVESWRWCDSNANRVDTDD